MLLHLVGGPGHVAGLNGGSDGNVLLHGLARHRRCHVQALSWHRRGVKRTYEGR
jgi:hypothetical protein